MRKILAVLLAVMMLASVLAMLPASAETDEPYDGSTTTSVGKPELIITEISQKSHGGTGNKSYDSAAGFVEVFNNTTASVDFSSLSLLRALDFHQGLSNTNPLYEHFGSWIYNKLFLQKMDIESGKIVKDRDAYKSIFTVGDITMDQIFNSLENTDDDLKVESGEAAIIWFITETTVDWLKEEFNKNPRTYDPRELYVKKCCGLDANASDYNVIMVWALENMIRNEALATDMFTWEVPATDDTSKSVIIALADDTWDLATDNCQTVNAKIKSMVVIGNAVMDYAAAGNNFSAVFAPATTEPFLKNKKNAFIGDDTKYADYVKAELAMSYVEVGAVLWNAIERTPGKLPDWQYAMMAAALNVDLPTGLDTTAALNAFFEDQKYGDDGPGHKEDPTEENYVDREELENMFSGANQDDDEGGNKHIIFIIIGAVVLVLAAVAVVLFVVILPKKKKAAAAAAASKEAPAEEVSAEETPVEEEAPVEEAPVEEKTEE